MTKLKSDYFFRNLDSSANRLDYVYHHPQYDQAKRIIQANVFRDLAALIRDNSMQYGLTASGKDKGETPFINIENLETDGRINQADISLLLILRRWYNPLKKITGLELCGKQNLLKLVVQLWQ